MGNFNAEAEFGRQVRIEREARGWTQAELAKRLEAEGISLHPSAIAKIELRDTERPRAIRLDEAQALANIFGLPLDSMAQPHDQRMRSVIVKLGRFLDQLGPLLRNEGHQVVHDISDLVASIDEADRERMRAFLLEEQLEALVFGGIERVDEISRRLQHPSRAEEIRTLFGVYEADQDVDAAP